MHIRARIIIHARIQPNPSFPIISSLSLSCFLSLYTTHAPPHSPPPATRVFAPLLSQPPFLSTLKTLQLAQSPLSSPTPCSHFPNPSPQSKLRFSKFNFSLSIYITRIRICNHSIQVRSSMAKTKPGKKDVDSYTIKGTNKIVRRNFPTLHLYISLPLSAIFIDFCSTPTQWPVW